MDPATAAMNLVTAILQQQTLLFQSLPSAQQAMQAEVLQAFGFSLMQWLHDLWPKFPAPPKAQTTEKP